MIFDYIIWQNCSMCLLFDIKEIIFCTTRPQYTHKIMTVFYFLSSCLATQLFGLVISAVCRWENAWRGCLCTTEFKCGRGIEHSGVRRGFANYGSRNILCGLRWAWSAQKAPFVLRTIEEQMEMIRGSEPRSLFIRLIQRVSFYQKGTILSS